MTEDKPIEVEVDEELEKIESSELAALTKRIDELSQKVTAWDEIVLTRLADDAEKSQLLHELSHCVAELRKTVADLSKGLAEAKSRLGRVYPNYGQNNCPKCGRKITSAGGKCSVCSG